MFTKTTIFLHKQLIVYTSCQYQHTVHTLEPYGEIPSIPEPSRTFQNQREIPSTHIQNQREIPFDAKSTIIKTGKTLKLVNFFSTNPYVGSSLLLKDTF